MIRMIARALVYDTGSYRKDQGLLMVSGAQAARLQLVAAAAVPYCSKVSARGCCTISYPA
eukprot:COSAG02_NODE_57178_length_281_cov_1.521978_1_plen_59_part_01